MTEILPLMIPNRTSNDTLMSDVSVNFKDHEEIGFYSLDANEQYLADNSQLRYLVMPPEKRGLHLDLCAGYSDFVAHPYPKNVDNIDSTVLKWISENRSKMWEKFGVVSEDGSKRWKLDFVSCASAMQSILVLPYPNVNIVNLKIGATKFQGTIYLYTFDFGRLLDSKVEENARLKLLSSWIHKFRQYMTSDEANGIPNTNLPVYETPGYYSLIKSQLGNHSLLLKAMMHAKDPSATSTKDLPKSMDGYVRLTEIRDMSSSKQHYNFRRHRLLKWWSKIVPVGIPKMICGFRNDDGIVHTLRTYDVEEIPKLARGSWKPSVCLNFCDGFLTSVKDVIKDDDPYTVYIFDWKPKEDIFVTKLKSSEEFQILPEWYISAIQESTA